MIPHTVSLDYPLQSHTPPNDTVLYELAKKEGGIMATNGVAENGTVRDLEFRFPSKTAAWRFYIAVKKVFTSPDIDMFVGPTDYCGGYN